MNSPATTSVSHPAPGSTRLLLACLIPFTALTLQLLVWQTVQPYVWIFFYPAVFLSSWLGGLRGGLAAAALSTVIVWWFFIPIRFSFQLENSASVLAMGIFAAMGVLFSFTHERLRKANRQTAEALEQVNAVNADLEQKIAVRTTDQFEIIKRLRASEAKYRQTLDTMLEGCQIIGFDWCYLYINAAAEQQNRRPKAELLGNTVMECWPGITETEVFALEKCCMEERTPHQMDNEFIFPDGSRGWFRLIIQPMAEGIVIFSEDITARKGAEEEIHTLNDRLHHLINAIQELASARTLERVQQVVATSARRLTGADGATVVFREGECCYYADEDAIEPLWKGKRFPLTNCISGWVMLNGIPAVIPDILADERIPQEVYRPTFVKSLVMIPVIAHEPLAAIGNYWSDHHTPSEMEIQLLQTLANAAARAVENVHLLEALEQRVQERTAQLESSNSELERLNRLFVGRELRMKELKTQIAELGGKLEQFSPAPKDTRNDA